MMIGYIFDTESETVPEDIRVRAIANSGAAFDAPIRGRINRPDVPAYFKIGDWALRSGFEALLPTGALEPGDYHVVLTYSKGDKLFACDNGRTVTVLP